MGTEPKNVYDILDTFDEVWSPRIVNRMNDYDVRIAHVKGEYVWHSHEDTDEFFLVLDGHLAISLRDEEGDETSVELGKGDTFIVPRGVEHRPMSRGGSILMFEPAGTASTGDVAEEDLPDHIERITGQDL